MNHAVFYYIRHSLLRNYNDRFVSWSKDSEINVLASSQKNILVLESPVKYFFVMYFDP